MSPPSETTTTTGDFKGQQFKEEEVADKVVEQYDEKHARIFYKHVMVRDAIMCVVFLFLSFV